MLTKRQLEDAARCMTIDCEDCSVYCVNTIEVTRRAARTALAYRDMLERLEWNNRIPRCPICGWHELKGHAPTCELAALLKGDKAEETRGIVRLIETKPNCLECENCGELWVFECEPRKDKYNFIKYCPNCGVKFDEYVSYVTNTKEVKHNA